jgi:hypothetical protein
MSAATRAAVTDAQAKIAEYLKNPVQGQTFGHLMVVLGFGFCVRHPERTGTGKTHRIDGVAESRILDQALQKLRKAGRVTFDRRVGWALVDPAGVRS